MTRTIWWFTVKDENSELDGEEFFVEVGDCDNPLEMAWDIAVENFDANLKCYGQVTAFQAEMMGFDTY